MANQENEFIPAMTNTFQEAGEQHLPSGMEKQLERVRVHRSMYLQRTSYDRLNEAYKMTSHKLYPLEVRKSTFMEACIAYALNHIADIEAILSRDGQQQ